MISWTFSKYLAQNYQKLIQAQKNPLEAQHRAFKQLKKTTKIQTALAYDPFVRSKPACKYEEINTVVERALQAPDLKFIGLSSGTTGFNSKQVPINQAMLKMFSQFQLDLASVLEAETQHRVLSDYRIGWGTTPILDYSDNKIPRGYVSGFLSETTPWIVRRLSYPHGPSNLITDFDQKLQALISQSGNRDIRYMAGVPSYLINVLEGIRSSLKIQKISELWPNLASVIYSGTAIAPFRDRLDTLVGHPLRYLGFFAATEGPLGLEIPLLNGNENGLYSLNLNSVVYGFKKLNSGEVLSIDQIKESDELELLISTPNGFINYSTGDVVKVVRAAYAPLFKLCGRVGQGINIAAEKTTMEQLEQTIKLVQRQLDLPIEHYFVHPSSSVRNRPCYHWTIVTDSAVSLERARIAVDQALCQLNGDYEENRKVLQLLDAPIVEVLPVNFMQKYFFSRCQRGQLKMKTVFDTSQEFKDFVNEINPTPLARAPEFQETRTFDQPQEGPALH